MFILLIKAVYFKKHYTMERLCFTAKRKIICCTCTNATTTVSLVFSGFIHTYYRLCYLIVKYFSKHDIVQSVGIATERASDFTFKMNFTVSG